jgi:hypothetical protein
MIRAKMYVSKVDLQTTTEVVQLWAVTSGSEENKSFAQATPCASLNISIDNPKAQGFFKEGQEYYVDFTPAKAA